MTLQVFQQMIIGVNIYPNPSNGVVNFDAKSLTEIYQIFNGIGKLIWEEYHKTMHINLHSGWYINKPTTLHKHSL